jgi:glucan phosphoethanolaminetransferase (alkaline phosphatase superfamily)
LRRGLRLFIAPGIVLAACMVADVALRHQAYGERLEYLYYRAGVLKIVAAYGLSLAVTALLLAATYAIPRVGKYLIGVLVAGLFVANQAYHATIGHFINVADARVMENADRDVFSGAMAAYFRPDMLIFIPIAIALGVLAIRAGRTFPGPLNGWGARGLLAVGALVANCALWDYLYIKCHDFPVEALTSTMRTAFYVEKENREFLSVPREELPAVPAAAPTDNIVLIVDESVRVDYVSINNPAIGTTPFLAELARRPGFVNYGLMIAATTCSFTGKALMFTGTTVAPDRDRRAMSNPTIFQHAKRWGYRTIVLDGPGRNFPNIAIRERDLGAVDVLLRASEIPGTSAFADLNAAAHVRKVVTESQGNFIVLIKVGAHFHYERCYPSAEERYARFLPRLSPARAMDRRASGRSTATRTR